MADVVVTFRIMPESPEANLKEIEKTALEKVKAHTGNRETKTETEPVAFGLNAIIIRFVMDEGKGATDSLEDEIRQIASVASVNVTDVRRTIG